MYEMKAFHFILKFLTKEVFDLLVLLFTFFRHYIWLLENNIKINNIMHLFKLTINII